MFSGIREITWEEEDKVNISPQTQFLRMEVSSYGNVALFRQFYPEIQRQSYLYINNQRHAASFEAPHFLE